MLQRQKCDLVCVILKTWQIDCLCIKNVNVLWVKICSLVAQIEMPFEIVFCYSLNETEDLSCVTSHRGRHPIKVSLLVLLSKTFKQAYSGFFAGIIFQLQWSGVCAFISFLPFTITFTNVPLIRKELNNNSVRKF